jgi:ATP-dependent helicase HrpB
VRVSRAAADQRRGRAGRTEPGVCYRLWDEPQTAALEPFARPEILAADLSAFALDLAAWGAPAEQLAFLDPPPHPALSEARSLLIGLGALDDGGRITDEGHRLRRLPLPPRLARMVLDAAARGQSVQAAEIAALVGERGLGGSDVDLRDRLDALRRDRSPRGRDARGMAQRWAELAQPASEPPGAQPAMSAGALLALAYPERIAKNRGGGTGAFLLANGRGATIDPASSLAREPYLAVAELAGSAAAARILLAAPIALAEIEQHFGERIVQREEVTFDTASARLRGRRTTRLGALVLSEQVFAPAPSEENARNLAAGIAGIGLARLPWTTALRQWRDRVMFLRRSEGDPWPDMSDQGLTAAADEWLAPLLAEKIALADVTSDELQTALHERVPWALRRRIEAEAPTHFEAPTGTRVPIDYDAEGGPKIAIRVQELFGLDRHPAIAGGKIPLLIELLSPAQRPVQTTRDLPGFWRGSYAAVRTEMRGRYPKHPWPDDPIAAAPTWRAKPRNKS